MQKTTDFILRAALQLQEYCNPKLQALVYILSQTNAITGYTISV